MSARTVPQSAGPMPYDLSLPEAGLDWERVGPLFERYSIKLIGHMDQHWVDSYHRVAAATPSLSRFRLDMAQSAVSFTCRATDGPVEVMTVLKVLDDLVQRVNKEACLAAARLPGPRPVPPPASRLYGKSK